MVHFNFDPRSAYLNTEIGVLLNSPSLARAVHDTMDQNLSKYAYKLVLDANQNINWKIKKANGDVQTFTKEPKMKWYQKARTQTWCRGYLLKALCKFDSLNKNHKKASY